MSEFYSAERATLELSWREDGGLRVHSPTHPGLVLSHSHPDKVMLDVLPVLAEMNFTPPKLSTLRDRDAAPRKAVGFEAVGPQPGP
jgi:hypothetical protein